MTKEWKNLAIFFSATMLWTWVFYGMIVTGGHSPYTFPWVILLILGGAGPSMVGITMVLFTYDKEQRRDYWRRCFSVKRIPFVWWLIIFLIFPAIFAAAVAIDMTLGGSLPGMEQLKSLMANPLMWLLAAIISFTSGPWSEEFGWRGYALKPLLMMVKPIPASLILGLIWGIWHLPLFFMPATWHGKLGFGLDGFWTFLLLNIGLALVMTWVFQNTNSSILSGMLLHFTSNFTAQLIAPNSNRVEVLRALILFAIGLSVFMLNKRVPKNHMHQPVTVQAES